jgi:hypothetical protein
MFAMVSLYCEGRFKMITVLIQRHGGENLLKAFPFEEDHSQRCAQCGKLKNPKFTTTPVCACDKKRGNK